MSTRSLGAAELGAVMSRSSPGLEAALLEASDRFAKQNPGSKLLFERAKRRLPGGNTRSVLAFDPFPLYIAGSAGAHVRDVDGHVYLDALGEYSAGLYGHSDPQIRKAIIAATDAGAVNSGPIEAEIDLAEHICARFPSVDMIRFCNSATEANLYAITLARHATKRAQILCFNGAYHGGLMGFSSSENPLNVPFDWIVCRYNDIDGTRATIREAAASLAAVIVEPMMSNGGSIPASREFLAMLRHETDRAGATLIFDEVVTSRMGPSGLQGVHGIAPDLTTFGKYLGGGFPFGAFGGAERLMSQFDSSRPTSLTHAGTFNNNIFSMTAGLAGIAHVFTPQRASELYERGELLRRDLNRVAVAQNAPATFTGCGSVMNVHFTRALITAPEDAPNDARGLLKLFHLDMFESGIYAARRGLLTLSLAMVERDLACIVNSVERFFDLRRDILVDTTKERLP